MLPYSPLHHLLLDGVGRPLVMTSGNLSDEPIAHDDADAIERLGPMVGGLLTHDRPIHIRCDDSVARAAGGRIQLLRRSHGHAPEPLPLPFDTSSTAVLAVGAELKSTVAVTKGRHVVASHHIGDLEHLATYRSFLQAVDHLPRLYGVVPEVVAHDLHPEYLSTKFALELGLATIGVQHHHAHAAVVSRRARPHRGGAGDLLRRSRVRHRRHALGRRAPRRRPVRLPPRRSPGTGGDARWRRGDPRAVADGRVVAASGGRSRRCRRPAAGGRRAGRHRGRPGGAGHGSDDHRRRPAVRRGGSCARRAAARVTFEAQAAIELEAAARTVPREAARRYPDDLVAITRDGDVVVFDPAPLLAALVADRDAGVATPVLAAAFHEALGTSVAALAASLAAEHGLDAIALTGGVFQNVRFSDVVESSLAGFDVLVHERIPANDGGISIGQAAIAAWAQRPNPERA